MIIMMMAIMMLIMKLMLMRMRNEDGQYNLEKDFNHVIDVNALVDLRPGAVFELFRVFIQSTFSYQLPSANL